MSEHSWQRVDLEAVNSTNAAHRPHKVVIDNMLGELAHLRNVEVERDELRNAVEQGLISCLCGRMYEVRCQRHVKAVLEKKSKL